jgi:hypothetical protein
MPVQSVHESIPCSEEGGRPFGPASLERRDHPSGTGFCDFPGVTILDYAGDLMWKQEEDYYSLSLAATARCRRTRTVSATFLITRRGARVTTGAVARPGRKAVGPTQSGRTGGPGRRSRRGPATGAPVHGFVGSIAHTSPQTCPPPPTSSVAAVVQSEAGDARKTTAAATSSTVPKRGTGSLLTSAPMPS